MTRRVWIIPAVIAALTVAGLLAAGRISLPTLTYTFDEDFRGASADVTLTVRGVHCYGTADMLREHIEEVPGLVSLVAYAGRHKVLVEYDPASITPEEIAAAIEAPADTPAGSRSIFTVLARE